jgi:hypothetical protein
MRTPREVLRYLRYQERYGRAFDSGMCLKETHDAYLVPSDGTPDATTGWERTRRKFFHRWVPGAFMWWTGGSHGHGHVAICAWKKGFIRTVDYPHMGHWNTVTVAELEKAWPNIKYAGMSLDIDGVKVRRMPRLFRRWSHP